MDEGELGNVRFEEEEEENVQPEADEEVEIDEMLLQQIEEAAAVVFSEQPPQPQQRRPTSRLNPSYKPTTTPSVNTKTGPRVQRLQKSYVVRDVKSKYPTEIPGAVKFTPPPSTETVDEGTKSYIDVLTDHFGYDPSSLLFSPIEDRILHSGKAADESESEHYQRITACLQNVNQIKQSRVQNVMALVGLGQKDVNDTRQHERYTEAIAVKRDKATSEIKKEELECDERRFALNLKQSEESQLGYLQRSVQEKQLLLQVGALNAHPTRPTVGWTPKRVTTSNSSKRGEYIRRSIK